MTVRTVDRSHTATVGLGLAPEVLHLERARLVDLVARINESPVDHVAVTDHVAFRGGRGWDGVGALTFLAGLGITKPLHTGVLILPLRHPTVLARQLLDLADLHPAGIVAGVGLGGDDPTEYSMVGMSSSERGARMDDSLELLRHLLAPQTAIDSTGHYAASGPGLARRDGRRVKVLVGGRAGAAHQRAAASDGWLAAFCSPNQFARGRQAVLHAVEHGAGAAGDPICAYQAWVGVGSAAREEADAVIADFYGLDPTPFRRYTPAGSAEHLATELAPYVEAGCDQFNLFVAGSDPELGVEVIGDVADDLRA